MPGEDRGCLARLFGINKELVADTNIVIAQPGDRRAPIPHGDSNSRSADVKPDRSVDTIDRSKQQKPPAIEKNQSADPGCEEKSGEVIRYQ